MSTARETPVKPTARTAPSPGEEAVKGLGALTGECKRILQANQHELETLYGNIVSAAGGAPMKTLLVTSSRPGEGKTTTAILLAHGLAVHAKARVILVDGNFRSGRLHEIFGFPSRPGLLDLVSSSDGVEATLRSTWVRSFRVLTIGSRPADSAETVEAATVQRLLAQLAARADYVIVDADSVLTSSGWWLLGKLFDGVVLVAECEKTKWEVLEASREKIAHAGGTVLGVVLNKRKYYVPKSLYARV